MEYHETRGGPHERMGNIMLGLVIMGLTAAGVFWAIGRQLDHWHHVEKLVNRCDTK